VKPFIVGVPPGVGDLYWCLTKLRDYKRQKGIEHLRLVIQATSKDRAGDLCRMVDFVDSYQFAQFRDKRAESRGYLEGAGAFDAVMWPNTIVDRGEHLRTWLPEFALELDVGLKTEDTIGDSARPVIYPSAKGVNDNWFPQLPRLFWPMLIEQLTEKFGAKPILIGASWDIDYAEPFSALTANMLGLTSLPQVAYLLEHAPVFIGVASGMTILANRFKTPTIAFFPDKHHAQFPWTWTEADYWPRYSVKRARHLGLAVVSDIAQQAYELALAARSGRVGEWPQTGLTP
jgi:hypothetical protein